MFLYKQIADARYIRELCLPRFCWQSKASCWPRLDRALRNQHYFNCNCSIPPRCSSPRLHPVFASSVQSNDVKRLLENMVHLNASKPILHLIQGFEPNIESLVESCWMESITRGIHFKSGREALKKKKKFVRTACLTLQPFLCPNKPQLFAFVRDEITMLKIITLDLGAKNSAIFQTFQTYVESVGSLFAYVHAL